MAAADLSLNTENVEGIALVHVEGPLDSLTYEQFKSFIDELSTAPHARIILDCQGLSYVNSRGITLLAQFQRTLSANLAFFGIANANTRILKAIDKLGVAKLIRMYPTLDDALAAARALASSP